MKLSRGKQKVPIKFVIYGPEGIGKTTLASEFPKPLFIDVESGTKQLDVTRVDRDFRSWRDIEETLDEIGRELERNQDLCKTLVIDTIDVAETLLSEQIVAEAHNNSIRSLSDFAYGAGQVKLRERVNEFLKKLDGIRERFGVHIVLLAHSHLKKCEKPDETGSYDRYELKMSSKVAERIKEWCDILLFLNYKTQIVSSGNKMEKKKLIGGERVIYTTHHNAWDAKNRFKMPEEMSLDYINIAPVFDFADREDENPIFADESPEPIGVTDDPDFTEIELKEIVQLKEKMKQNNITEEQLIKALIMVKKAEEGTTLEDLDTRFIQEQLLDKWESFMKFINRNR